MWHELGGPDSYSTPGIGASMLILYAVALAIRDAAALPLLEDDCTCAAAEEGGCSSNLVQVSGSRLQAKVASAVSSSGGVLSQGTQQSNLDEIFPLSWDEAEAAADRVLQYMEHGEKNALLRGIGWTPFPKLGLKKWWYVGNTAAISRLDIPSLNMQDAAGGFRTYWTELVGTVTAWPSLLSLAATWNPHAVHSFAVALGKEFSGKGANAVLGPSIEVHRVARNGRNFEYLSGEDPFLGSRLVKAYVDGVQSQGVLAVMKHWVFNHQETNRGAGTGDGYSSDVDEKTAWELYLPPFQAAVNAGVSAAMCSYNKVNGVQSCSNKDFLEQILKKDMGFRGFVQSDWWALHNNYSLALGLDQDMPGWPVEAQFFSGSPPGSESTQLAEQTPAAVDDAARRILASMFRLGVQNSTKCSPPHCQDWFMQNVTTSEHVSLARRLAAQSIVLLQNNDAVLPLKGNIKTLAVVGAPAVAKAYNPAGAGQENAEAFTGGDYYSGGGSGHVVAEHVVTPLAGIQDRAASAGIKVLASPSDDLEAALAVAGEADVTVVVAATTSSESVDRKDLHLDGNADALIPAVASRAKNTLVLVQAPGAVLLPWRHNVSGILCMFLGGQQTGAAWADVLFGDQDPVGHLPIMLPETEGDTIQPSNEQHIKYTEGLATSYRNPKLKAAFPFGHGLTYTTFEFVTASEVSCDGALLCVEVMVRNTGGRPGTSLVQLYVELSAAAGQPSRILKAFESTGVLAPAASTRVLLPLTKQELSYFDVKAHDWVLSESATAHIGESSARIHHSLALNPSLTSVP
eukprot:TRINITY_DN17972_c0_g1_i1.p1 TRINITY_DN17972_c0_g1~~TRINITY_DN17972_c0_g1_i1.p1  ORF type:complete len:798 (+),score=162.34 TRINITY_DN17972_c0_g1_i1:157-2550(+)